MKLLTLNVHAWLEDNQAEKIAILAQTIVEKGYDIIALQEVNQLMTAPTIAQSLKQDNYGVILLRQINRQVEQKYSLFWSNSHIGYDKYDEGIAFLTRLPVYEVDPFYCSQHQRLDSILSRKILGLTIEYQNQLIDCYSCHINLPDCEGEDQLDNIRNIVKRNRSGNLKILMGDFNTDAISNPQAYQQIKSLGLLDSYELAEQRDSGITVEKAIDGWRGHSEEKRLDYIFFNQAKKVLSSQVIFNGKNKPVVSDHFGLEVDVIL
ncbi:endonuclease/exonuclease/phosphatase family protein [Rodentibacter pneumotropicus]|uniref:Endonuclease n=1 Tax=Rodentibacter pneumotropicus TaxID=758 RepID=A0A4S2PRX9_9PAST|nr:endonuclease/exonuclease/phosphatase family protein [Rodentibacter pneumotropicus]TGZ98365.1 endonuclease [Rodentibacter pneumotropicus]THA02223.1 endonuclease [Rodentibacter pneumotropicus]THA06364.1 endonuclease [Rodentibacter pneumotropicus]THA12024.1 endonuclease [Rodentibacter pneumotropicus]